MPTNLPRPRVRQKRSVFSVAFNGFLVGSALFLTFMVVVQGKHPVSNAETMPWEDCQSEAITKANLL